MPDEDVCERLAQFFASRGQRQIPSDATSPEGDHPDLAFTDGRTTTCLKVAQRREPQERNNLLGVALSALSYTEFADKTYLVLPKVQAAVLDAAVLREKGIGLITYDSKTIEEVLPARLFHHKTANQTPSVDLERLKSRISTLEQTVETLVSELSRIKSARLEQISIAQRHLETPAIVGPQQQRPLPSFLQDNPWLDILSKRGKEPDQIAG